MRPQSCAHPGKLYPWAGRLSNATNWGIGGVTIVGTDVLKETATTGLHNFANNAAYTRTAGIKTFQMFVDVTPTVTRFLELDVQDGTFADFADVWFDVIGIGAPGYHARMSSRTQLVGYYLWEWSKVRCGINFSTDASSTQFNISLHYGYCHWNGVLHRSRDQRHAVRQSLALQYGCWR